ncbi:lamin tail domain-containing protein, partial [bacterium]|nr:lamin tail domain-containing protein [bacterium]
MKPHGTLTGLIALICAFLPAFCQAEVVINEILYDPEGIDTGLETVELLNVGATPFDLSGYELKLADSDYFTFPTFSLAENTRVIIHNNAEGENTETDLYTGLLSNMGNTQGSVALFSGAHTTSNIIDFVQYGNGDQQSENAAVTAEIWIEDDFAIDVDESFSLNLEPDGQDNNSYSDWAACLPSPLEVNCNPFATPTPSATPSNTAIPTNTPTANPPTNTPTALPPTDTPFPTITPTQTAEPSPIVAEIIVNEVFYDPDGNDTGLEWIEVLNIGAENIVLTGWDIKPASANYFTFPEFSLNSGNRVIIHINTEGLNTETELFAGLSSNMGNTSGSIVLFNNASHALETII